MWSESGRLTPCNLVWCPLPQVTMPADGAIRAASGSEFGSLWAVGDGGRGDGGFGGAGSCAGNKFNDTRHGSGCQFRFGELESGRPSWGHVNHQGSQRRRWCRYPTTGVGGAGGFGRGPNLAKMPSMASCSARKLGDFSAMSLVCCRMRRPRRWGGQASKR